MEGKLSLERIGEIMKVLLSELKKVGGASPI